MTHPTNRRGLKPGSHGRAVLVVVGSDEIHVTLPPRPQTWVEIGCVADDIVARVARLLTAEESDQPAQQRTDHDGGNQPPQADFHDVGECLHVFSPDAALVS